MIFTSVSIPSMIFAGHANLFPSDGTTLAANTSPESNPVANANGQANATSSHLVSEYPVKSAPYGWGLDCCGSG